MAAILDEHESRDFHAFLDNLDSSTENEAAIVGGAGFVYRRPQEPTSTSWENGAAGGMFAGVGPSTGQGWRAPPYGPHTSSSQLFPHLLGGAPSSFAPPPQHVSRPSYPLSYAAPPLPLPYAPPPPPSIPYPAVPLDSLDQDKLERMAKQARELSEWMGARGDGLGTVPPLPPAARRAGDERPEQGDEGRRSAAEGSRAGLGRRGYSHERPPLMKQPSSGTGSLEDTMQRMREAEERIGFARRVRGAMDAAEVSEGLRASYSTNRRLSEIDFSAYNLPLAASAEASIPASAARPPAVAPPRKRRSITPPAVQADPAPPPAPTTSTKRKATSSAKGKAPARAATSTAPPPNDTDFDTDPALNPAPFLTPANIPPSLYPPPPQARPIRRRVSPSPAASTSNGGGAGAKPALLTAEQKKANHIASEQKRRAAIRQGYEALCTVVPALKAAVEEFEERVKKLGASGGGSGGRGTKKRRGSGGAAVAGPLSGGIDVGGEKVDGRAGPKSEAVVLGKTVEHLRNLLYERQALLERLSSLYQHGTDSDAPLEGGRRIWEEQWDGGPVIVGGGSAVEEDAEAEEDDE